MAVPKRKTSKSRKNMRKSQWMKLSARNLQKCPNCGTAMRPHRVCGQCGHYKGHEVVKLDD